MKRKSTPILLYFNYEIYTVHKENTLIKAVYTLVTYSSSERTIPIKAHLFVF